MKLTSKLKVPISGLKLGIHDFTFQIDDTFFDDYSESKDFQCVISLGLSLMKSETMIQARFELKGQMILNCARCNDLLKNELKSSFVHIYKFGLFDEEHFDEDISYILSDTYELDLTQLVYEQIVLSIPFKPIHKKGECNQEAITLLESFSNNKNKEINDPRWSALNDLNKN